jgi:hypothetical protein
MKKDSDFKKRNKNFIIKAFDTRKNNAFLDNKKPLRS